MSKTKLKCWAKSEWLIFENGRWLLDVTYRCGRTVHAEGPELLRTVAEADAIHGKSCSREQIDQLAFRDAETS